MCKVCERQAKVRKSILRMMSKRMTTADEIANKLGVSVRTIYRYVDELRSQGQPIIGASGAGYMLRRRPPSREGRANG